VKISLKMPCLLGILALEGASAAPAGHAPPGYAYAIGKHVYRNEMTKHLSIDINHSCAGLCLVQFNQT